MKELIAAPLDDGDDDADDDNDDDNADCVKKGHFLEGGINTEMASHSFAIVFRSFVYFLVTGISKRNFNALHMLFHGILIFFVKSSFFNSLQQR